MQGQPASRSDHNLAHLVRPFAEALNLIASGTGDDKVRWIAEHDPDWFVDRMLHTAFRQREGAQLQLGAIDRDVLDQAIASIALRDGTTVPLREAS